MQEFVAEIFDRFKNININRDYPIKFMIVKFFVVSCLQVGHLWE